MSVKPTRLKLVIVGDSACGKTSLLNVYVHRVFPEDHEITVFDTYVKQTVVAGKPIALELWDTAGQEDYDRLRPLTYPNTSVILLAFSLNNRDSLENAINKWAPEIQDHCPKVPFILVGTKKDLRRAEKRESTKNQPSKTVASEAAQKAANKIGAVAYMECSSRLYEGVDEIFDVACRFGLKNPVYNRTWSCRIL